MIEAQNLVKWYGLTHAIDNLTFSIPSGQIVGFLGPNGAGKSTTLRILTGYLPPTSGRATVAGHDVLSDSLAMRRKIGYMPETAPTYPEMRVEEYLQYRGKLYGMERALRRHRIDIVGNQQFLDVRQDPHAGIQACGSGPGRLVEIANGDDDTVLQGTEIADQVWPPVAVTDHGHSDRCCRCS